MTIAKRDRIARELRAQLNDHLRAGLTADEAAEAMIADSQTREAVLRVMIMDVVLEDYDPATDTLKPPPEVDTDDDGLRPMMMTDRELLDWLVERSGPIEGRAEGEK